MKYFKYIIFIFLLFTLLIFVPGSQALAGRTLSKDIAPDVPAETYDLLNNHAGLYFEGSGKKDILLIADTFCENSRKTYRLLKNNLKYIRSIKVLLVSRYPGLGSDIVASHVMRMHSLGKGEFALDSAFNFEVPEKEGSKARKRALDLAMKTFRLKLGADERSDSLPELEAVEKNTKIAKKVGYSGTPHFITGNRVLHGYSHAAIKIMLKQEP